MLLSQVVIMECLFVCFFVVEMHCRLGVVRSVLDIYPSDRHLRIDGQQAVLQYRIDMIHAQRHHITLLVRTRHHMAVLARAIVSASVNVNVSANVIVNVVESENVSANAIVASIVRLLFYFLLPVSINFNNFFAMKSILSKYIFLFQ